jgi:hypothetical protein
MLLRIFAMLAVVGFLASAGVSNGTMGARAESLRDDLDANKAGELAKQGLSKMMEALQSLIDAIPQYEKPTITEDGDIIIRRKKKDLESPPPSSPPLDRGET